MQSKIYHNQSNVSYSESLYGFASYIFNSQELPASLQDLKSFDIFFTPHAHNSVFN